MITYDLEKFFVEYQKLFGKMQQQHHEGLRFLLFKLQQSHRINSLAKHSCTLANVKWETAHTFQPITEYGSISYLKARPYFPYIGRGYIQLTWLSNYKKFGKKLNIDLVENPSLANKPEYAWLIMEMGMTDNYGIKDPDFTKYTLEDFINAEKTDYLNARKIINPKDYDSYKPIEELSYQFESILKKSLIFDDLTGFNKFDKIH